MEKLTRHKMLNRKKRRQNYVDKSVQGALLHRICFHWIAFFVVAALSVILLQTLLGDPSKTIGERLRFEMGEFVLIGIVMLSLFPVFMLDTIRFSNRFVGPIVRIRRHLRELGQEQNTDHCAFRDNDFWSEMAVEYNQVVDLVEKQEQEIEDLRAELRSGSRAETTTS